MDTKVFPICGYGVIPYELIKQHEEYIIKYYGRTLDEQIKAGGLNLVQTTCILKNIPYNQNMSEGAAETYLMQQIDDYERDVVNIGLTINEECLNKGLRVSGLDNTQLFKIGQSQDQVITIDRSGLRPCTVTSKIGYKKYDTKKAYFHRWCDKSYQDTKSVIQYVAALVEYEDGSIDEVRGTNIKFTDRGVE